MLVQEKKTAKKKKKSKGSFADSLAVLKSSPKIMNLALLVMSYGVSHRLFEFAWKGQLRVLYPSAQAYQASHLHCLSDKDTVAKLLYEAGTCAGLLAVGCCAPLTCSLHACLGKCTCGALARGEQLVAMEPVIDAQQLACGGAPFQRGASMQMLLRSASLHDVV